MEAVQTCSTAKQAPMEIERKFIPKQLPPDLAQYPYHEIEQGYLCTSPTVRIRQMDDAYFLTYKSSGLMAHQEYEMPLTRSLSAPTSKSRRHFNHKAQIPDPA